MEPVNRGEGAERKMEKKPDRKTATKIETGTSGKAPGLADREGPGRVWDLFTTFLKIGAFTFGGGYAMIPLIQEETVDRHGWIIQEDLLDIIAIAESTPGPIAINSATFVGYRTAGFWGSFAATVGVSLPSFLIIYAISFILQAFEGAALVRYAFTGIRAAVLALIVHALWSMYKACPKGLVSYLLMGGALAATALFKVSVLYVILACGAIGLIASWREAFKTNTGAEDSGDRQLTDVETGIRDFEKEGKRR